MQDRNRMAWFIIAVCAGLWGLLSLAAFGLILVLPFLMETVDEASSSILAGGALINLSFAVALGLVALHGWRQHPSPLFYPRRGWMVLLVTAVSAGIGAVLLPVSWQGTFASMPFHLALIVLPALFLFSLVVLVVGRAFTLTWRQSVLAMASGLLSTLLALPLEMIGFLFSVAVVAFVAVFFPGGQAELMRLMGTLQAWSEMATSMVSPEELMTLLASPVVLGILVIVLSLITPLVEELGKTLIMPFVGFLEKPSLARAFLWGTACGVGFAVIEGTYNGGLAVGEAGGWLAGVLMRLPATTMHAFVSGLTALGWGIFWQKRQHRWVWLIACYAVAIVFHGLWNFNAIIMVFVSAVLTLPDAGWIFPSFGNVFLLFCGLFLAVLAVSALAGLFLFPWWLRRLDSRAAS